MKTLLIHVIILTFICFLPSNANAENLEARNVEKSFINTGNTGDKYTNSEKKAWVYMVVDGDSLWNISAKFLTNINYYTKLQKLNNIQYPQKMRPGSLIRIPMEWIKQEPASAKISYLTGKNLLFRENKLYPLTSTTTLTLGDEIRTGTNGSTTIEFADGSIMVLFKQTTVIFNHLSAFGSTGMVDTRVSVISGKVETKAQKNKGPGSRLDISTPSAISSVRGTMYRVANTSQNISTVEVLEGNVAVVGQKSHNIINVAKQQGTRIKQGEEPSKPTALLVAPSLITSNELFEKTPVIQWHSLNGAKQYNVKVSTHKNFKSIIFDQSTTNTSITLPDLPNNAYFLRVTGFDAIGLEGIPAYKKITFNLFPIAPKLINTSNLSNDNNVPILKWEKSLESAERYFIEIAKDEDFTQLEISKAINENQFIIPESLLYGGHFWRVSSIYNKEKGPASTPLYFNYKTEIAAPVCYATRVADNVSITWDLLNKDHSLLIEVAKDNKFIQSLNTYRVTSKIPNIEQAFKDEHFVRCKLFLNNSPIESQWSETLHVDEIDEGIFSLFGFLLLIILI